MAKKKAAKKTAKKTAKKKSAKKKTAKKGTRKKAKKASRRELIDTGADKRYVRRDAQGQFEESDDQGRSLSQDRRRKARRPTKAGQGDKGDRRRSK